ncbi:SDR family oxidoreductase [Legionella impletisoli]|uniref:Short-chain dehydrogenase n=1 Tax=Legionella impletisoli TaxID=343510 RepID=A0A917NDN5_9GAMM|nr:SDR family oxidoreductase [Legionella impletisoli]GGI90406.1 short-chain dehydrogenase [Legionella impletisoli]
MKRLSGKVVLITGASSGIGKASAKQFAEAKARLLLCARRLSVIQELADELQAQYDIPIHTFELDVQKEQQVNHAIQSLPEAWKSIDVLVNNAGLAAGLDTIQEGDSADWDAMIDTNIKGLLYMTRAVLPNMIERDSGHIINIGSIAGHQVYPKGAVYCATKHAVDALSQGLRLDLSGTKIRVSSVDPGAVETNFSLVRFKGDEKRAKAVYKGFQPLMPEDIADAILYCASRPEHINISEILIMPTAQAGATMIARK